MGFGLGSNAEDAGERAKCLAKVSDPMTTAVQHQGAPARPGWKNLAAALEIDSRLLAMIGALAGIWIGFDLLTGGIFLEPRNLWNLSVQTSVVGIMATGMVWVIVARHIDLSIGSVMGFIGMVVAVLQVQKFPLGAWWNWETSLIIGLAVGGMIGAFQGWWVASRGVPSFIVTLGGLLIFRGLAWTVTEGQTIAPLDPHFQLMGGGIDGSIGGQWTWVLGIVAIAAVLASAWSARSRRKRFGFPVRPVWAEIVVGALYCVGILAFVMVMNAYDKPRTNIPQGIPIPVLIMIGVVLVMSFVSTATPFGRYVWAIGGNPEAAELAGVNTKRMTILIFIVMGGLAALGGMVQTARLNAGANSTGELMELSVIAATVIGGTSLTGGSGTIAGAIIGALIMQSLQSGMILLDMPTPLQNVVIGLVLIVAVWADSVYQSRRR